jgi:hypothetical protein
MSATVLFGVWFLICLVLAFRAIRGGDIAQHRRWMIRAFAIGVGVGTIRIWIALFVITGLLNLPAAFGPASSKLPTTSTPGGRSPSLAAVNRRVASSSSGASGAQACQAWTTAAAASAPR